MVSLKHSLSTAQNTRSNKSTSEIHFRAFRQKQPCTIQEITIKSQSKVLYSAFRLINLYINTMLSLFNSCSVQKTRIFITWKAGERESSFPYSVAPFLSGSFSRFIHRRTRDQLKWGERYFISRTSENGRPIFGVQVSFWQTSECLF